MGKKDCGRAPPKQIKTGAKKNKKKIRREGGTFSLYRTLEGKKSLRTRHLDRPKRWCHEPFVHRGIGSLKGVDDERKGTHALTRRD